MFHNYCRIYKTLRVTPATEADVTDRLWTVEDVVTLIETAEAKPSKRGPYKKESKMASKREEMEKWTLGKIANSMAGAALER
jgi:hypothetical protein